MTLVYAIILLGIIIFVHELGHFLIAKLLGVRVLKFSLGFGPKLIGKKIGKTEYLISYIPFGGYVKMLGESHEDELTEEEKRFAYNYQSVWKRFLIVLSGPLFNILFALIIFFFIFMRGFPVLTPEIGSIMPDSPAQMVGLKEGDMILKINGLDIKQWDEMTKIIHNSPEIPLYLKVQRDNKIINIKIVPERKKLKDLFGEVREVGLIGIKPSGKTFVRQDNFIEAFKNSIVRTGEVSILTVISVLKLIQRAIPMDTIGGPILIVQMAGEQASQGLLNFFVFMAIINVNLGVLNLLPIPILDGGHILFLGIEAIRRKPINEKILTISQRIGLAFIITVMLFVLYNDIMRLITGKQVP